MSDKSKAIDIIRHCQKQFKKELIPEEKLLHYLGRLSRLRITVQDLAETGIGRTVNQLSRNEGPVGQAAETLVRSWKRMVSEQQSQTEPESEESDSNSGSSEEEEEEEDVKNAENTPYEVEDEDEHQPQQFINGHASTDEQRRDPVESAIAPNRDYQEDDPEEDDMDDIDDPYMENGFLNMANVHTDEEEEEEEEEDDNDSDASGDLQIADENHSHRNELKEEVYPKQDRYQPSQYPTLDESRDHRKSSHSKSGHHKSQENGDKRQSSSSSSSRSHREYERSEKSHSSSSSSSNFKEVSKEHKHHSSKSQHGEPSRERSSKQVEQSTEQKSHHHHHSSLSRLDKLKESRSDTSADKRHHKDKDKQRHSDKQTRESSHREKEGKSDKDRSKDRKEPEHHRSGGSHHRDKSRETSSSSNSLKKSSPEMKKPEFNDDRKRRETSDTSGSSSSKKQKLVLKEEIDSTSGINFADVLGSLDASSSKQKKLKKEDEKPQKKYEPESSASYHSHKSDSRKRSESPSKHSYSRDGSGTSSKKSSRDTEASRIKKPSKVESVIKPVVTISPHYKPTSSSSLLATPRPSSSNGVASILSQSELSDLGSVDYWDNNGKCSSSGISQEDAISTMLSSKGQRSKVYSGVKSVRRGAVPSLFDLCMQVIKDNIGDLGYTGGIPYEILKPALERANPQQLISIEEQNDYLVGETDELWQFHSKRDFRGRVPDGMDSWREHYEKCKSEQQQKFENIKKQMKRSIESAEPVRTTKLAYVDTSTGPRFNKQKAQTIKNGMKTLKIKEEKGPKRGVASSASAGFNNPKGAGDKSVVVEEAAIIIAPESRAGHAPAPSVSREPAAAKFKPKKAPLMQKTMKLIRSLNRR